MMPLRRRLMWFLLPGLAALIALGGGLLYPAVKRVLVAEFDHAQLAKLEALTTLPEPERQGINLAFTEGRLPEFQPGPEPEYFQVWLQDGSVLARSASLGGADLPFKIGPEEEPVFADVILPGGQPGRLVGAGFGNDGASAGQGSAPYTVAIVLARDTLGLNRVLNGVLAGIIIGGVAMLVMAALLTQIAARQALRPVDRLAGEVREIDIGSLEKRLPAEAYPPDLRPIAEQVNHLMERVHAGFERERRFSANAAHELLTPVAELRTMAEAAREWSADPEATKDFATDTLESASQMEHIVRNLLSLAGAEASVAALKLERVELAGLLEEIRGCFADEIRRKDLQVDWRVSSRLELRTDRVLCRSILFNLFDNAAEYTPAGGAIRCEARPEGGVEVVLGNAVEGIGPEDLEFFHEPLWRKDSARSARVHAGLGLSVSRTFAQALGGSIQIALPRQGWLEISVRFPERGKA